MHDTAFQIGQKFFELYLAGRKVRILEVGSLNVNGTLRDCAPPNCNYVGVDITAGPGVDSVLKKPESFPFAKDHFDAVVASSCFEHAQMFWLTFLEMVRVSKPGAFIYINVPSNGSYHSYPYDNWRFYPDAGLALTAWAAHEGKKVSLVESFIARRKADQWNDAVLVFRAGSIRPRTLPTILLSDIIPGAFNIRTYKNNMVTKLVAETEDVQLLSQANKTAAAYQNEIEQIRQGSVAVQQDLERQRDQLVGDIETLWTAIQARDSKIAETEGRFTSLSDQFTQLRLEANDLKEQLDQAIVRLEASHAVAQERERVLSEAMRLNADELRIRETEAMRLSRELEQARSFLRESRSELQQLSGELDGLRDEVKKLNDELRGATVASLESTRQLNERDRKIAELDAITGALRSRYEDLSGEHRRTSAALLHATQEREVIERRAEQLTSELREFSIALDEARKELNLRDERLSTLTNESEARSRESHNEILRLRESLDESRRELNLQEERLSNLTNENEARSRESHQEILRLRESLDESRRELNLREERLLSLTNESEVQSQKLYQEIRKLRDQLIDTEAALARTQTRKRGRSGLFGLFSNPEARLEKELLNSGLFDNEWYMHEYGSVISSRASAPKHYLEKGYLCGFRPNPLFDTRWYLDKYVDVRKSGLNPAIHYLRYGAREGRNPGPEFETDFYLISNPDVRANGMNPLAHYLRFGRNEGRLPKRKE